jgi:YihY family inner membrane protein
MGLIGRPARVVLRHPLAFLRRAVRGFQANQGLLLAGAIAYYALLSLVPLLALSVKALSRLVEQEELLATLGRYLEWLVPSQSAALLADIVGFLDNGGSLGVVLLVTMLFFSSLAFSVLEKAMAVIFAHRGAVRTRHTLVSVILPYCFVLALGIALLGVTTVSIALQAVAQESIHALGRDWSLRGLSGALLYLLGFATEAMILTTFYLAMPVGPTRVHHALIGGLTTTVLWEVVRYLLLWYFATLSQASVVYGSLTTAVVALFAMEIAATLLLFGAQVISEYERLDRE